MAQGTMPSRKPTLADVARLAGVSQQTASRVVNGYQYIHAETRERVQNAIELLGYQRNAAARSLATGRSDVIGVVIDDFVHSGPARALGGIERAAREAGYAVTVVSIGEDGPARFTEALRRLKTQNAAGIVVVAPENQQAKAARLAWDGMPIVTISPAHVEDEHGIEVDTVRSARAATRHLIDLGHERIMHIAGPPGFVASEARITGWRAELAAAGLAASELAVADDWTPQAGYDVGRRATAGMAATGVFVANDELAQGLLLALHEAGRRVPDDVSVVGYDDSAGAAYCIPPLTTVRQDFDALGRRSIERLVAEMEGRELPPAEPIVQRLVVRSSTGPPTDRHRNVTESP